MALQAALAGGAKPTAEASTATSNMQLGIH